jgi:hypothetical protein
VSRSKHVQAVLTRLREHPALADRVFEGVAVKDPVTGKPRTRYVTIWVGTPRREVSRYTGPHTEERYRFTIHSVSQLASDVGDLDDAVTEQLLDWTPTIDGRACRRMVSDEGDEMQYDSDLTPPLYWIPSTWDLTTEASA